ncbi:MULTISPECIES: hypothetical protein [unclassified Streptomyces]|uniref:hypothetical protein n=1 Tax=unclassified Streptomyces TaxID=2593676 RepID=UPI0033F97234
MSYDIYFLSRDEGQSWDDVVEAAEGVAEDSEPIPPETEPLISDVWLSGSSPLC